MLGKFNTLPPKPEYIEAIVKVLSKSEWIGMQALTQASRLTKTQASCAIDDLLNRGVVISKTQNKTPKTIFALAESISSE